MSKIQTVPGKVAVRHKQVNSITTKKVGSMMVVDQKLSFTELEVLYTAVFPDYTLNKGDSVFVYSNNLAQAWAKQIVSFENEDVLLVPASEILLVKHSS